MTAAPRDRCLVVTDAGQVLGLFHQVDELSGRLVVVLVEGAVGERDEALDAGRGRACGCGPVTGCRRR
jgi:hypothetical protein